MGKAFSRVCCKSNGESSDAKGYEPCIEPPTSSDAEDCAPCIEPTTSSDAQDCAPYIEPPTSSDAQDCAPCIEPSTSSDAQDCAPCIEPPTSSLNLEVSESSSCIKQVTPYYDVPPGIFQSELRKHHEDYLNFPLLQDKETMEYIQKSKVMVIMKGLPGSGKSHVIRRIQEMYKDAVVCSADSYFMQDGKYNFNKYELKDAHKSCQQKAQEAAQSGCHIIVIDNTNIRAWESEYYLKLTKEYNYTPLILEPQTPWAMDPKELAQRNMHDVTETILARKLKDYQSVLPMYYWWFLNEADSKKVSMMAQEWLKRALQVRRFFQDFAKTTKHTSVEDMLNYYSKNAQFGGYNVLHATAKVTRRGKAPNAMDYINSSFVRESLGKCFRLHIIGYVITRRTFGARLKLGESELELWGMDDNEIETEETTQPTTDKNSDCIQKEKLQMSANCHNTVTIISSELKNDRFFPTSGKGSRAHLTLGCAPNVHARTTGFDLINVVSCEQRVKESESGDIELSDQTVETYSIPEGVLKAYGDGIWVIYPEKEMAVSSLFSAFY